MHPTRQGNSGRGRRAAGPRSGKPAAQCGLPQPRPRAGAASAVRTGKTLRITIADDGAGYPPAVLHALQTGEAGENTPHILVCTSSSRSSAPTAARRPLPGTHRAGQRRCWCCRWTGRSCRTVGVGDVPPRGLSAKIGAFRRAAGGCARPLVENAIFFYSHKIILILVDFLGITLYNVYYK